MRRGDHSHMFHDRTRSLLGELSETRGRRAGPARHMADSDEAMRSWMRKISGNDVTKRPGLHMMVGMGSANGGVSGKESMGYGRPSEWTAKVTKNKPVEIHHLVGRRKWNSAREQKGSSDEYKREQSMDDDVSILPFNKKASYVTRPSSAKIVRPSQLLKTTNRSNNQDARGLHSLDQFAPSSRSALSASAEGALASAATDSSNENGVVLAWSNRVPVVYRSASAKESDPERLVLSKMKLSMIPLISQESPSQLSAVILSHNLIARVNTNLAKFTKLVYLDFSNNKLVSLANLTALPNLRVLMLARNELTSLQGLENLPKLDILDVNSNALQDMQLPVLEHLVSLRKLNLSGNRISAVDDCSSLEMLEELNLSRNNLVQASKVNTIPSLTHLFLNNNVIRDISGVLKCPNLVKLSLDSNDISDYNRSLVISKLPRLQTLDLLPVTAAERQVILRKDYETAMQPGAVQPPVGDHSPDKTQTNQDVAAARGAGTAIPSGDDALKCPLKRWCGIYKKMKDRAYMDKISLDFVQHKLREHSERSHLKHHQCEDNTLKIVGDSFDALNQAQAADSLLVQFCSVEALVNIAFPKLSKFNAAISKLVLVNVQMKTLTDLGTLAKALPSTVTVLRIKFSSLSALEMYRPWIVHFAKGLLVLDGVLITDKERNDAKALLESINPPTNVGLSLTASVSEQRKRERFIKVGSAASKCSSAIISTALDKANEWQRFDQECFNNVIKDNII